MPEYRTSGTTGKPKTFNITEEQLNTRFSMMNDASRGTGFETIKSMFIDFAKTTYLGRVYSDYTEAHGMKCYHASLGSAKATVDLFESENIEGIFTTPSGLYNYALEANGKHKFKWMSVATSRLSPFMSKTIRASFGDNLWSSYACSEIGVISIATGEQIETIQNCVGKIIPGVEVSFDGPEILARSNALISGYNDPSLTSERFKDGWYYTGDFGHMDGDLLVLDGRKKY